MRATSSFGTTLFAFAALAVSLAVPACDGDDTTPATPAGGASAACQQAPKVEKNAFCAVLRDVPDGAACDLQGAANGQRVLRMGSAAVDPARARHRPQPLLGHRPGDPALVPRRSRTGGHAGDGHAQGLRPPLLERRRLDRREIEIFKEGDDGSLGEPIGTPVTTTSDDDANVKKEDWLEKCPDGGCSFRGYSYAGVPTETRLIVKTSDASGGSQWAALYDYNIFFPTSSAVDGVIAYDPSVVAATDINTVASAAGGFSPSQEKGMLAGEVHDCGDVRLAGATVDIDAAHEGDMFYFGENEANPLPDKTRTTAGTSKLGLFGTLNVTTGVPIRISALGIHDGQTVLLGTHTVQAFKGGVTALRLRGRRPWQQ